MFLLFGYETFHIADTGLPHEPERICADGWFRKEARRRREEARWPEGRQECKEGTGTVAQGQE